MQNKPPKKPKESVKKTAPTSPLEKSKEQGKIKVLNILMMTKLKKTLTSLLTMAWKTLNINYMITTSQVT